MEKKYPHLFSSMVIRGKYFRNRILFSAHGHPQCRRNYMLTEEGIAYYAARARGGAAQVTVGETPVDDVHAYKGTLEEQQLLNVPRTNQYMTRMCKFPNVIHSYGALASIQLCHAGQAGADPIGPTGFVRPDGVTVKEMDEDDIRDVVNAFRLSARRAREIGMDGVQIHGGHGWLIAQFVSPLFNKRTDQYGGSLENRLRFPIMVLKAVREEIGENMLIEYRISGDELTEGGLGPEETAQICRHLEPYVDLFQVSVGVYTAGPGNRMFSSIYDPHCCNAYLAEEIKRSVSVPVIAVGAILSPEEAEEMIAKGQADFVAIARGMLADPQFAKKAMTGRSEEIIPCVRCYQCMAGEFGPPFSLECSVNPYAGKEDWLPETVPHASSPLSVVIIGGGPGGMQAALTAAQAGHHVTLFEKQEKLGGALSFTDVDVHKQDLKRFRDYLIHAVTHSDVQIRLNTAASPGDVEKLCPDVVITAVGAVPRTLRCTGDQYASYAGLAYDHSEQIGHRVVMIGGGLIGCETALHLYDTGHKVTVVEALDDVSRDAIPIHKANMMLQIADRGIPIMTETTCREITPDGVTVCGADGREAFLPCDTVLYAIGMSARREEAEAFGTCAPRVVPVGDCLRPGKVKEAVHGGYFAVRNLI